MRVFIIVATHNADAIKEAIQRGGFPSYPLKGDAWLVASDSTTRELAENLGIRRGTTGSGLVCLIDGYSGRLPKDAWEWLNLYEERQ